MIYRAEMRPEIRFRANKRNNNRSFLIIRDGSTGKTIREVPVDVPFFLLEQSVKNMIADAARKGMKIGKGVASGPGIVYFDHEQTQDMLEKITRPGGR